MNTDELVRLCSTFYRYFWIYEEIIYFLMNHKGRLDHRGMERERKMLGDGSDGTAPRYNGMSQDG
jgi:hypothetical protein